MGYRSDIRIVTSKKGYKNLEKYVNNYLDQRNLDSSYNLLNSLDIKVDNGKQICFGWDCLKWYDNYPDVDAIMNGLNYLSENELSYRYMRLGESYDDIEEQYYDGEKDDTYLIYPSLIRNMDDQFAIETLLSFSVKNWYMGKYPSDKLGMNISKTTTFYDLYNLLSSDSEDISDLLGCEADSIIEERCLEKLSSMLNIRDDEIYNKFLNSKFEKDIEI